MINRLLPFVILLVGCGTLQKQNPVSFGGAWESANGEATFQNDSFVANIDSNALVNDTAKCDVIILNNGDEINAIVSEIGLVEVKYKHCDNLQGPTISVLKEDVFMIKYRNGSKDVIKNMPGNRSTNPQQANTSNTQDDDAVQFNALGTLSTIVALTGFFIPLNLAAAAFLAILGLVLGIISTVKTTKNPEKFTGKAFSILGIILSLALIFSVAILI